MTASAVRPSWLIPVPRPALDDLHLDTAPGRIDPVAGRAVAYQRVLHQLVRRELRMLADLASWAPPGEGERTLTLTRHSELISRVLMHHHAVEREAVWPALLRSAPAHRTGEIRAALDDWRASCARIDNMLRDVATAARQWQVAGARHARDSFAGRAGPWPTPSTRRPSRRSAPSCRCSVSTCSRPTGPPSPPRRTAGCRRGSSCSCSGWRSRTPPRPIAPGCWRASPGRPAWPGA